MRPVKDRPGSFCLRVLFGCVFGYQGVSHEGDGTAEEQGKALCSGFFDYIPDGFDLLILWGLLCKRVLLEGMKIGILVIRKK